MYSFRLNLSPLRFSLHLSLSHFYVLLSALLSIYVTFSLSPTASIHLCPHSPSLKSFLLYHCHAPHCFSPPCVSLFPFLPTETLLSLCLFILFSGISCLSNICLLGFVLLRTFSNFLSVPQQHVHQVWIIPSLQLFSFLLPVIIFSPSCTSFLPPLPLSVLLFLDEHYADGSWVWMLMSC